MEDDRRKAQVEGKQDLVENPHSVSETAASGTKLEVEGAKRPCVPTRMPDNTAMDDTEDEEEEQIDMGEDEMQDGGYYLCFEGNQIFVVGKRPPAVKRMLGPPHPNALTYKRMRRRMAETGLSYIRGDDPVFAINWNPFPVAAYSSPTPTAASASET